MEVKLERKKAAVTKEKEEIGPALKEMQLDIPAFLANTEKNAIQKGEGLGPSIVGASQEMNIKWKAGAPEYISTLLLKNANSAVDGLPKEEKIGAKIPKKITQT